MEKITRVYRYGLLPPHEGEKKVREQMWLAHRYRNKLVEIARERRSAVRKLEASFKNAAAAKRRIEEEEKEVEHLGHEAAELKQQSKLAGKPTRVPKELRDELAAARTKRKEAFRTFTAVRWANKARSAAQQKMLNKTFGKLRRAARAACGAFWGTYLLVEASDDQAQKMPLYQPDGSPNDPRFVRWRGDSRIGVQLQHGLTVADALAGEDTRLRIEVGKPPEHADPTSRRSAKRRYATLAIRIGSNGRAPVWARFKMVLHRPLPENGQIQWAVVHARRIGPRTEWYCALTVKYMPEAARTPAPSGAVAVDVRWAHVGHGEIRVAEVCSAEERRALMLPADGTAQIRKAEELRSVRDDNFNTARALLIAALLRIRAPKWLKEKTETLAHWRAIAKLAAVVRVWKNQRFKGDEVIYTALEAWRYHDHHLWAWESSAREKGIRHRREVYRVFAARLAEKYDTLVVEKRDLRPAIRVLEETPEAKTARANGRLVAAGVLRDALKLAFTSRGRRIVEVPRTESDDRPTALLAAVQSGKRVEPTGPRESRWAKAKRMKREADDVSDKAAE